MNTTCHITYFLQVSARGQDYSAVRNSTPSALLGHILTKNFWLPPLIGLTEISHASLFLTRPQPFCAPGLQLCVRCSLAALHRNFQLPRESPTPSPQRPAPAVPPSDTRGSPRDNFPRPARPPAGPRRAGAAAPHHRGRERQRQSPARAGGQVSAGAEPGVQQCLPPPISTTVPHSSGRTRGWLPPSTPSLPPASVPAERGSGRRGGWWARRGPGGGRELERAALVFVWRCPAHSSARRTGGLTSLGRVRLIELLLRAVPVYPQLLQTPTANTCKFCGVFSMSLCFVVSSQHKLQGQNGDG